MKSASSLLKSDASPAVKSASPAASDASPTAGDGALFAKNRPFWSKIPLFSPKPHPVRLSAGRPARIGEIVLWGDDERETLRDGLFPQSAMKIRQTKILGLALLLGGLTLAGLGLWLLLSPAQYVATAKIWVVNDVSDYPMGYNPNERVMFDPYFTQTTFEIIQSGLILSNVVATLNLNETWGKKYFDGSKLTTAESIKIINQHLRLAPVRNTSLIEITYISDDPKEAAYLANAIADGYRDYRLDTRQEISKKGMEILQQQYQDEEKQLLLQPTNREQLLQNHKLLAAKIEAERLEMQIPKFSTVQIVDQAKPPQFPVSPNRTLGAVLFAAGLLSLLAGILLLKLVPKGTTGN